MIATRAGDAVAVALGRGARRGARRGFAVVRTRSVRVIVVIATRATRRER